MNQEILDLDLMHKHTQIYNRMAIYEKHHGTTRWMINKSLSLFQTVLICWYDEKGNTQSIGIEICVNSDGDFAKTIENAITLVKISMARYNLNWRRVVQHN